MSLFPSTKLLGFRYLDLRGEKVTGRWEESHEELHDFYLSPNIITQIKSKGSGMWYIWGKREMYRVPIGKPEERRPLARSKSKWKDHTHTQIGRHGMDSSNSGERPEIMQTR